MSFSLNHRPEWTSFIPASTGSTRIHAVALNWRPGETGEHLKAEALCGARVDLTAPAGALVGKVPPGVLNCGKCRDRMRSIQRSESNYAWDEDRAYMSKEALAAYYALARAIAQVSAAVEADAVAIRQEISEHRAHRVAVRKARG